MKTLGVIWYIDQIIHYEQKNPRTGDLEHIEGMRGVLTFGLETWPIIGRAQGYKRLRPGKGSGPKKDLFTAYLSKMSWGGPCLRILDYPGDPQNRMCIHSANYPHQLNGCIAPGLELLKTGVGLSSQAIREILKKLDLKVGEKVKIKTEQTTLAPLLDNIS